MQPALGVHHLPTGAFNWYLVEDAGALTLVDAGFPGHYRVFREGLRSIGRSIGDIKAIALTHAHGDHMGFIARAAAESKAPVFVHADDVDAAARRWQLPWAALLSNAWRPYTASMLAHAALHGAFSEPPVRGARIIRDGDRLDIPGAPTVLHIPGHTPGQIALHLPGRSVLLSSDTLVTRDLYTGDHTTPQLTRPALNHDFAQALRSIDRLGALGEVTMLPGHGRPWRGNMADAVAGARDAAGAPARAASS